MIYLIDRGFRIKSALNILVNQCKYPGIYNECFCLSCNVNDKDNVNVNVNDKDNVNDNDNFNDKYNVNDNDNFNDKDNVNDNDNVIDNDNDNDNANDSGNDIDNANDNHNDNDNNNFIYILDEKHGETWVKPHQKFKPNNNSPTNSISININDDLYSWLNDDDDIITEAAFPDNFRCIIPGPSECGKTFLLKKLILASIYFDKLYIIGPTGD